MTSRRRMERRHRMWERWMRNVERSAAGQSPYNPNVLCPNAYFRVRNGGGGLC